MLSASCMSTDSDAYGCTEKLVMKEGVCIHSKSNLQTASVKIGTHIISDCGRFSLYHCFKSSLQCKRYLESLQSRLYKTALAPFRFGVSRIDCHRLHFSAAVDHHYCPFDTTSTEDEHHFLFKCHAYTDLRTKFSSK